ncbi:MAG TPA: HlyD family efflux transporter periplasmic adaptor subunit [Gaiellaceae bacterium]|nr:HlyD family efflux transporter periplasmic adaptor subunit [Gaiellaceae bacterium]
MKSTAGHAPLPPTLDGRGPEPPAARAVDGGPPPDPGSPFREEVAAGRRRTAQSPPDTQRLRLSALRAWLVVLVIVGAAVFAGYRLAGRPFQEASELRLSRATVAATAIGVPAPGDGLVEEVLVRPAEPVERGAALAVVSETGEAGEAASRTVVRTPIAGVVSAVLVREGGAVRRGSPVAQIYDPASTMFEVPIDGELLGEVARGMRATLTSPALDGELRAVVHGVKPAQPQAGARQLALEPTPVLVLRPLDPERVRGLVPGLALEATIDPESVPERAPRVLDGEP